MCNDTCTSFSKCYIIKQLLTNEALDMLWYRPENTNIDRGKASVNIGILWSISQHFASVNIGILWLISQHIQCLISQRIQILTEAKPRSILVFSGRYHSISPRSILVFSGWYHSISNASLVNNCIIFLPSLVKQKTYIINIWISQLSYSWTLVGYRTIYLPLIYIHYM